VTPLLNAENVTGSRTLLFLTPLQRLIHQNAEMSDIAYFAALIQNRQNGEAEKNKEEEEEEFEWCVDVTAHS